VASIPGDTIIQLISAPIHCGKISSQHLSASCETVCQARLRIRAAPSHCTSERCPSHCEGLWWRRLRSLAPRNWKTCGSNSQASALCGLSWPTRTLPSASHPIPYLDKYPPRDSGLAWLQDVLGQPSNTIYNALENLGTVDMTRLFMASFHIRRATFRLRRPSFVDTLAVLMRTGSETAIHRGAFEGGLSEFLRRAEIEDHLREVPDKLCRISEVISPTGLESLTSHK